MLAGVVFCLPTLLAQCPTNAINALVKRHLSPPLNNCKIRLFNPFLTCLRREVLNKFKQIQPEYVGDKWRNGKTTTKLRQIDESKNYDRLRPQDAKSFIKREINVLVPTKARLIQGHKNEATAYEFPDEYCMMSKTLQAIGGSTVEFGGTQFRFVYAGGLNHAELSNIFNEVYDSSGHCYFDERDGKSWDATMNKQLLEAEASVYEMLGLAAKHTFLKRCSGTKGKVRCHDGIERRIIKYLTAWKRLSGDWNTSVGNTIISMIIVFTAINKLPAHLRPRKVTGFFMGDDYLGVYGYDKLPEPQDLCDALNHYESQCGITPERGIFTDPLFVSFISLGLWPCRDGGYAFVPKPGKQLAKLFWAVDGKWSQQAKKYASAIAQSFWMTYYDCHFMQKFLRMHYIGKQVSAQKYLKIPFTIFDGLTKQSLKIDWQQGFVLKYRLPYSVMDFEMPNEPGIYHHMAVNHMIAVDLQDPHERVGCLAH